MNTLEFKNNYRHSIVLDFNPPSFKEFLSTATKLQFAHWFFGDFCIVMFEDNHKTGVLKTSCVFEVSFLGDFDFDKSFRYFYSDYLDNREEVYYRALDYLCDCLKTFFDRYKS